MNWVLEAQVEQKAVARLPVVELILGAVPPAAFRAEGHSALVEFPLVELAATAPEVAYRLEALLVEAAEE